MKDHVIVADDEGTIVQGVPIGDGLLPIAEQTELLYAGGLRRFCFENVWAYSAPVTVAVGDLPTSPSFSQQHHHHRLDGRTLEPSTAVEREWAAFRSAWDWLRADLARHGFVIAPE